MTQSQSGAGVLIGINELIIQLQYILGGIKRTSPALVHRQMCHGLIRKKVGFAFKFEKSLDAQRPVELLEQEQHSRVHRFLSLARIAQKSSVTGKLTIGQIIRGRVVGCGAEGKIGSACEKENVGIDI